MARIRLIDRLDDVRGIARLPKNTWFLAIVRLRDTQDREEAAHDLGDQERDNGSPKDAWKYLAGV